MFVMAVFTKAFQYEKAKSSLPRVKDSSKELFTIIEVVELLGGIHIICGNLTYVRPK